MIELALNNVEKYFGATQVLKNITFEVQGGEKVGIVGRNGSGKSTILKIIAGIEKADKGTVILKRGATIGYLDQIPNYNESFTVAKVLGIAFSNLKKIEDEMKTLEISMHSLRGNQLEKTLKQYSYLQECYEAKGGYETEEKYSKICAGFKFTEDFLNQLFYKLSGGEKTTVILAKMLLESPDIMLLDEPSNHLDMEALEWLEGYLKEYKGMVLIVSHDRYFLDNVASKIIEIEDMESEIYKGNYTNYVEEKENRLMLQFEAHKEQQKKISSMEETIKQLRDWAIRGGNDKFFRRAASMQKRLEKMDKIDKPVFEGPTIKLSFKDSKRSGNEVIKVEGLSKSFGDKVLFNYTDFLLRFGERVAFIGPNGSGKSTLIKMILSEEIPDSGLIKLGSNVKIGYLPQQVIFPDEESTVLQCFRDGITILEGKAREYLSKFLFFGESVFKKVKNLSGGERSRLKLSKLLFQEINLLILDEPTNHLDIDSIETLEEALTDFKGTIFFISHDRYFINKISDKIMALEDRKLNTYEGNYDYYRQKNAEKKPQKNIITEIKKEKIVINKNIDEKERKDKERRKLEEAITSIELEIEAIEKSITEALSDYEVLGRYYDEKLRLQELLDELMQKWINL
ncbi:ribosomal protection-like ABC-F family protein [Desnuesiella massiliensis]|uniref:ribosomal protection-like ABC-F family protein n=1 Tax=Desnuesiella massiliensis TaxID=1650662 RepID=UPI0006E38122|nr:ABC-F type ribosomal protection protein [Desnuesiella massiliensis]